MTDRHTPRHERKPKPVSLPRFPGAQGGGSGVSAPTPAETQDAASEGRKTAFARFMALAWPWVPLDSPEWRNLRAAWDAGAKAGYIAGSNDAWKVKGKQDAD